MSKNLGDLLELTDAQYKLATDRFLELDKEIKAIKRTWPFKAPEFKRTPDDVRNALSHLEVERDGIGRLFWGKPEEKWFWQSERGQEIALLLVTRASGNLLPPTDVRPQLV